MCMCMYVLLVLLSDGVLGVSLVRSRIPFWCASQRDTPVAAFPLSFLEATQTKANVHRKGSASLRRAHTTPRARRLPRLADSQPRSPHTSAAATAASHHL